MTHTMFRKIRLFIILVALSFAAGFFFERYNPWLPPADNLHYIFNWTVGPMLVWGFEIFFVPSRWGAPLRKMFFLAAILVKALYLMLAVITTVFAQQILLHGNLDVTFLIQPGIYIIVAFILIAVSILHTITQVIRIIGGRVLVNFILGRYHRPVQEERIFMFLDLAGSTALAERLGDIGVQTMITRLFFDITEPIIKFGGEIHRYVGDQVIIIWPLSDSKNILQAIRCYFAIAAIVRQRAPRYEEWFKTTPHFWAALHGGSVVISECGDLKQEIVYFGDTVNMTARIEQQCKTLDCPFLISAEMLNRISLPADMSARSMGSIHLRGRERETELFTITEEPAPVFFQA